MTKAAAAHPRATACRLRLCIFAMQRSAAGSGRLAGVVDNARRRGLGCKCGDGCANTCTFVTVIDVEGGGRVWRCGGGSKKGWAE